MKTKMLAFLVVASTALLPRSAAAQLGEQWGYDHRGGDYLNMVIRSVGDCKQVCAADDRCRAYTYLRSKNTCYLKDRVFRVEANSDAVTGVKRGYPGGPEIVPPPPPPIVGGMTEEAGIDRPGYDYTHFAARDAVECKRACFKDDRCRAYSFLSRFGNCYLKSGVSSPRPQPDVVSGYKRGGPEGSGPGPGLNVTREVGWDHRGGDYRSFGAPGVDSCRAACASDRRCRAYTYLRSSRSCYLKDRVYDPQQNVDAVSGVKSY
jgi:hypothetical protein